MTAPALAFREVTVRYDADGAPILASVSFVLEPGERVALLGLNGSGKTTLLLSAVGLVPHEGEILIAGERLAPKSVGSIRERVGFVFNVPEDQLLFPKVLDDVSFGLVRRGLAAPEAAARARKTLALLGVEHLAEAPLHHLSHGQKQRVALAGALTTEPSLLLLDEPSAGLDPPAKRALGLLLAELGAAMVVATHDLDFAGALCTRFLVLEQGRIVCDHADPDEAKRRWEL
jgi:energy-coupling factor transporter ATP-binding protein EcfA2